MDQYGLRRYLPSDIQAVVDVINAASSRTVGFPRAVMNAVGNLWSHRLTPFASEKIVAVNHYNDIVGYAYFTHGDNNIVAETGGAVRPDHWGKGIGMALIEWAEERAQDTSRHAPTGVRTVIQISLYESEIDAITLFKDHGDIPVREWMPLVIELDEQPKIPTLSPDLILRDMDLDNDWDIVGPAMNEAFADHWGNIPAEFLENAADEKTETADEVQPDQLTDDSYSNAPGYCLIVLDGETVAGGILCNAKLVERADTGRVGSIFVRPNYRRHGIAQTLMLAAFEALWKNGFRRITTDTDANSFTESTKLYKGLGMKPYRSEFTYEKEIRPGREVRR